MTTYLDIFYAKFTYKWCMSDILTDEHIIDEVFVTTYHVNHVLLTNVTGKRTKML